MIQKKIVYIVSDIEKSLSFEWTAKHLSKKYDLFFLLIGKSDTELTKYLFYIGVSYTVIDDTKVLGYFAKWIKIFFVLKREKPDIIHVHLWRAMLLGITSGWVLRIKKRILTRHYSTLQHVKYPSGVKWDKLCSWLATDIVAVSENVKTVLIEYEHVKEKKIHVIHHGFDMEYFNKTHNISSNLLSEKYFVNKEAKPVIGVISRYVELKGVQYIISAFEQLIRKYPEAHLILANAIGDYSVHIKQMLHQLPENSYTEIEFENELSSLYKIFDVFVHVPVDEHSEAFGQTYVEALAMGVPSVFTLSGVAREFIRHDYNAVVVPYKDSNAIVIAIERILQDQQLRDTLVKTGQTSVQQFSLDRMIGKLETLYE